MAMNRSRSDANKEVASGQQSTDNSREHDQDSDPPRTAVPPGASKRPFESPAETDPTHDQDSDPPRTAVPPKT